MSEGYVSSEDEISQPPHVEDMAPMESSEHHRRCSSISSGGGFLRRESGCSSRQSSTKSNSTNHHFWINCLDENTSIRTPLENARRYSFDSRQSSPANASSSSSSGKEGETEDERKENLQRRQTSHQTVTAKNKEEVCPTPAADAIKAQPSYEEEDASTTLVGTKLLDETENNEQQQQQGAIDIFVESYHWAYDVWKAHGLMHRSKGIKTRTVATRITYLQSQIWNEKLLGPNPEHIVDLTKQEAHEKQRASRKSFTTGARKPYGSFDEEDASSTEQLAGARNKPGRMSLPASVHGNGNGIMETKVKKEENFANILKRWREKSDDRPNSHFLSPEQQHHSHPQFPSLAQPHRIQLEGPFPEPVHDQYNLAEKTSVEEMEELTKQEQVFVPKERSSAPTRRTTMLLQKKRAAAAEEQFKEPKPTSPQSQASRIKARYINVRHPSRSRSLSSGRTKTATPANPPESAAQLQQQIHQTTRSPPRSRGDFKSVVQNVLRRVDVSSDLIEGRPVSAPRSGRDSLPSHLNSQTPSLRTKSAPRAGREYARRPWLLSGTSYRSESRKKESGTLPDTQPLQAHHQQMSPKTLLSSDRSSTASSDHSETPTPESSQTKSGQQSEEKSHEDSFIPGKSKFDIELQRAASAPRQRRAAILDHDKPKPENLKRLSEIRLRRIARQEEKRLEETNRSKSAPRPEQSRPAVRPDGAIATSGESKQSEESEPSPVTQTPVRVKDLLKLNTGSGFARRRRSCSGANIPSHVEVRTGHGDGDGDIEDVSLADSKLTDTRTEYESSAGVPVVGESPWTAQMLAKLEQFQGTGGITPRSEMRLDRPWRRDRLKSRMSNMSDKPTMEIVAEAGAPCCCSETVFSDRDELIEFFLPLLGSGCTCGKRPQGLVNPDEPTAIENILRPWQVEFLAAFGIYRGDQMVKAHHRSSGALATALRQYRKRKNMTSFRTKSCAMALEIWSKTSRAFVRSIRKQLESGTAALKLPNTLYILSSFLEKLPSDDTLADHAPSVSSSATKRPRSRTPTGGTLRERALKLREFRRLDPPTTTTTSPAEAASETY